MFRIVIADWRRILAFYLAGTTLWLIIHLLIVLEMSGHCCLDDRRNPFEISAEFVPDLLAKPDRKLQRLTEGLPLP